MMRVSGLCTGSIIMNCQENYFLDFYNLDEGVGHGRSLALGD